MQLPLLAGSIEQFPIVGDLAQNPQLTGHSKNQGTESINSFARE